MPCRGFFFFSPKPLSYQHKHTHSHRGREREKLRHTVVGVSFLVLNECQRRKPVKTRREACFDIIINGNCPLCFCRPESERNFLRADRLSARRGEAVCINFSTSLEVVVLPMLHAGKPLLIYFETQEAINGRIFHQIVIVLIL